ncbi:MAG: uracil-DNA glycosylase [Alphaproteobacteria bacterium]|nr:uracil-DNA glycosylase [Alphaproteobacteria bacterium]
MSRNSILDLLKEHKFNHVFNPYFENCQKFDRPEAKQIRREILDAMIGHAAEIDIDSIWVGRDLGHRGGRRTGLALTDDVHFNKHLERWSLSPIRPTIGEMVSERTASVIWEVLARLEFPIFLWNVFPLHPFQPSDPFTNRSHTAQERRFGVRVLTELVTCLKPKRLVGIGNDAFIVLKTAFPGIPVYHARHPSYGGQRDFVKTISKVYSLEGAPASPDLFSYSTSPA